MEESVTNPEELLFAFWKLRLTARGTKLPYVLAVPVSVLMLAVAWKLVQ